SIPRRGLTKKVFFYLCTSLSPRQRLVLSDLVWFPQELAGAAGPLDRRERRAPPFQRRSPADDLAVSTFRDAAKQLPELAKLFAPIIHEDAALIDPRALKDGMRFSRPVPDLNDSAIGPWLQLRRSTRYAGPPGESRRTSMAGLSFRSPR